MPLIRLAAPSAWRTLLKNPSKSLGTLCAALGLAGLALFSQAAVSYRPGPVLRIDVRNNQHDINPAIYGLNLSSADPELIDFARSLQLPVLGFGGSSRTRYNWETDATNAGEDDFFFAGNGTATYAAFGTVDTLATAAADAGAQGIFTIPLISKINSVAGSSLNSSFPRSLIAVQQAFKTKNKTNTDGSFVAFTAGNGRLPGIAGTPIAITGTVLDQVNAIHTDNSVDHQSVLVQHLVDDFGVAMFQLDNEPSRWHITHRDVQPTPVGFSELVDRTIDYAIAIKDITPNAAVIGPGDFGIPVYATSGGGKPGDNSATHDGLTFAQYYLTRMREAELLGSRRLLDYFDEHYFPSAFPGGQPIALAPAGNATTQAQRLASTRSLWASGYVDPVYGVNVALLPRFRNLVDTIYAETKVSLSAYNFGGLESVNGALTQAEVLGIFGREGLDMAALTGLTNATDPGAFAFRLYRDYDGAGSQFGDLSVQATSRGVGPSAKQDRQAELSVYAAVRTSDSALTAVVINKTANTLVSNLMIYGFKPGTRARVFRYSAATPTEIVRLPDWTPTSFGFAGVFNANSVYLLEIPNRSLE